MTVIKIRRIAALLLLVVSQLAQAESENDLAKAKQNPLGRNPKAKYVTKMASRLLNQPCLVYRG
jgi:hypothetical protein